MKAFKAFIKPFEAPQRSENKNLTEANMNSDSDLFGLDLQEM